MLKELEFTVGDIERKTISLLEDKGAKKNLILIDDGGKLSEPVNENKISVTEKKLSLGA